MGRYEGYTAALAEAGLDADPPALVRFGRGGEDDGYKYAMELMTAPPEKPTAIFCANDRTAWGAYQQWLIFGFRFPPTTCRLWVLITRPSLRPPIFVRG